MQKTAVVINFEAVIWLYVFFALPALAYTGLMAWLILGWRRLPVVPGPDDGLASFSIVVPVRNEAHCIVRLLSCLRLQYFPAARYEVIVVDDHSTDASAAVVSRFINTHELPFFRLLETPAGGAEAGRGKKAALARGIAAARHDYIITCDADCVMGPDWLPAMAGAVSHFNPHMLIGPVGIESPDDLFGSLQALEMLALTAVTAGAAGQGKAVLCSGANLLFRRDLFHRVGGYQGNEHLASGDDVFLLHKFKGLDDSVIHFVRDRRAMVYTPAANSAGSFFRQRARWIAKTTAYRDIASLFSAAVAGGFNLLLLLATALALFLPAGWFYYTLLLWLIKGLADFFLIGGTARFFRRKALLYRYPLAWLLYPFYVLIINVFAILGKGEWKG